MLATVSLRFREQRISTAVLNRFLSSGWDYKGFIPGPEYTTKSAWNAFNFAGMTYAMGSVEKDQWFMLIFSSSTATELPSGLGEVKISGQEGAFFKANRPIYLESRIAISKGEGVDQLSGLVSRSDPEFDPTTGLPSGVMRWG